MAGRRGVPGGVAGGGAARGGRGPVPGRTDRAAGCSPTPDTRPAPRWRSTPGWRSATPKTPTRKRSPVSPYRQPNHLAPDDTDPSIRPTDGSRSELATDMRRREPGDLLDVLEPVALLDQAYRVLQRPAAPGGGHAAHLHRPPVSRRPPAPSTSHARILPAATLACVTSSPATWRAGRRLAASPPRRLAASPPRRQMTAGATRVHLHHRANAGPAAGADRGAARDRQAGPRLCGDVSARTSGIDALA